MKKTYNIGIKELKYTWLLGEILLKLGAENIEYINFHNASMLEDLMARKHKSKEDMLLELYRFSNSKYFKEKFKEDIKLFKK